jgi:hypothetical protein
VNLAENGTGWVVGEFYWSFDGWKDSTDRKSMPTALVDTWRGVDFNVPRGTESSPSLTDLEQHGTRLCRATKTAHGC